MASRFYLVILVVGCITTGCMNSLFTKYQDNQCVHNCSNPNENKHETFNQPALQTLQMFIGELSCFLVYYMVYKSRFGKGNEYNPLNEPTDEDLSIFDSFKLALPSICDMTATTLLNVGLIYTPVSIYQMTRGSIVLFVAILSVLFLRRKITKFDGISLIIVTLGVVIVGMSWSKAS